MLGDIRSIKKWGGLDVLLNNAGITLWTLVEYIEDLSIFDRIMRTNYLGSVYCTYYALSELKKAKGIIAATSSGIGLMPVTTRTAYCASKYAMFGFFDSLRLELRGTGVCVTVIAPGFVETEFQKRALDRTGKALGESPVFDRSKFLSAEKAADIIVSGIEKRKRLVVTDRKVHFARWIYPLLPNVIEFFLQKAFRNACGKKTY